MEKQRYRIPRARIAAVMLLTLLAPSCGDQDNPVDPADRLCGGEAGFAARVEGRSTPVAVCTSNEDVITAFSVGGNYVIQATMAMGGTRFQFDLEVPHRTDFPVVLTFNDNRAAASVDDFAVWMYFQEIPDSGEDLESYEITGGTFTLTFSDTDVLAGTFADVAMKMRTQETTPQDRGTRVIKEGFVSLSVDD